MDHEISNNDNGNNIQKQFHNYNGIRNSKHNVTFSRKLKKKKKFVERDGDWDYMIC